MRVRYRMSEEPSRRVEESSAPPLSEGTARRVLIGGVGYWWQRDASFGLVATRELARRSWPPGVDVVDLDYGALYVVQDLESADPPYERLILLGAAERGRMPGEIYVQRWTRRAASELEVQARIREAGAGVVDLDHLLIIAQHFGALPRDVVVAEIEPVDTRPGESLSPRAAKALPRVVEIVRHEALGPLRPRA